MASTTAMRPVNRNDAMSEDDLLTAVLDLAKLGSWATFHVRNSRAGIVQGPNAKGFPDLVLVRDRVLFRELKSQSGQLTTEQDAWRLWLLAAGADWAIWRPSDWYTIESTLLRREQLRPGGR